MAETSSSLDRRRRSRVILPWAAFVAAFLLIAMAANRGLEMSDEAFYIVAITDPGMFKATIHPFGVVFHLVWQALQQSLVWLRLFGLCLLAGSSAILGYYLGRYYAQACGRALSFDPVAASASFGLVFYADISVMTPSYNLLANSAACLILAGVLGWWAQEGRPETGLVGAAPSVLVGFGGCLAFFAKPTFAALAAAAVAAVLAYDARTGAKRAVVRRIAIAASACLVPLVSIIAASVGFQTFIESLAEGLRTIRFGNDLASLPLKTLSEALGMPRSHFATLLVLFVIAVWRLRGSNARLRTAMLAAAWIVLAYDISFFVFHLGLLSAYGSPIWVVMAMPTYSVILAVLAIGLARSDSRAVAWRDLLPVGVLLCLPFAISFGTAAHILVQIAISMFAYLLAGAILADLLLPPRVAAALQALLLAYGAALLLWAGQHPYRLPAPIWEQTRPIHFGPARDRLYVDEKTWQFVESLRAVARREGLVPETPIVDLTGNGPGAALLLNGNAPYFPWIISWPGQRSADLADAVWRSLGEREKRDAWIILPADPALVDSEPMQVFLQNRERYRLATRVPNMNYRGGPPVQIWVPDGGPRR